MAPSIAVGRQVRIDEMIEAYSDDQLGALTYLGIMCGDPELKPRLRQLRDEIARRALLDANEIAQLTARIEVIL